MLTPHLEKLIHQGLATYHTISIMSLSNLLQVNQNKRLIITDIWYFDFLDLGSDDPNVDTINDFGDKAEQAFHQVSFRSKNGGNNSLLIKDSIRLEQIDFLGITNVANANGMRHFPVYFMHDEDVYIDIVRLPNANATVETSGQWPGNSSEANPPQGYGRAPGGETIIVDKRWNGNSGYSPETRKFVKTVPPGFESSWTNTAVIPVDANTVLNLPDTNSAVYNRTFPVMNIACVLINDRSDGRFNKSTQI